MGITIGYRGRLPDLSRVEDFEDRLLDFALEVGALAQIWRTHADDNPERMVRGLILHLAPGQEPTSLLLSPEGWLIGLVDIEDAEQGRLTEPPWCFTKTQFGPLEGHVALVELLVALRREFVPELEISDDGGYYPDRNLTELKRRHSQVGEAIDRMAEGLQRHGLTREAAEDPEIVLRRIEGIAAQVHRILHRPSEHPPIEFPDDTGVEPDPAATEALWDELYKHNRRQQERMQRSIEERRSRGEDDEEAFDNALGDLGLEVPEDDSEEEDEPWREESEEESFAPSDDADFEDDEDDTPFPAAKERHPLLKASMDLLKDLHTIFRNVGEQYTPSLQTLFQGAGDAMGGLSQALTRHDEDDDDPADYGLRVTQLKRALRGAAFARGALYPLRPALTPEQFKELHNKLGQLEKDIFQELTQLRDERRGDES